MRERVAYLFIGSGLAGKLRAIRPTHRSEFQLDAGGNVQPKSVINSLRQPSRETSQQATGPVEKERFCGFGFGLIFCGGLGL